MPNSASRRLQTPPTATRAAVSRALARSRIGRTSSKPYFTVPARSAWPGRRRVTFSISLSIASTDIASVQLTQSRFSIVQRDRAAEREAVADAGDDLGAVLLDLLAAAAAVALLAPRRSTAM